jgi:diguanylate cyclase (GGDEF)-like protein/PAS domain S-box-containing protein
MAMPEGALLVVGAEESNRDTLGRGFASQGYEVTFASDGSEALGLVEQKSFDVLLLDVTMHKSSGLRVLEQIRQRFAPAELPVIIVMDRSESDGLLEAFKLGANDYLTKPVDFAAALARVATHVAHRRTLSALRDSETRYALAARGTNDGLWDWNQQTQSIYYSPRWKAMLGYDDAAIASTLDEWLSRVHPEDRMRVERDLSDHTQGLTVQFDCEYRIRHKDGSFRWMLSRGLAIRDSGGRALRMAGSQTDITGGKVADALTGLPNRVLFVDRVGRAVERARRNPVYRFAVLFLDLDRFKLVNDSLGHHLGDQLLIAIARRLESCLRATDTIAHFGGNSTVARLGGDEFTILLDDLKHPDDMTVVAERILKAMAAPFHVSGHEIYSSASIGGTMGRPLEHDPEDLLREADTAMYAAKSQGKARFNVFDDAMHDRAVARLNLENALRRGLELGEFELHYQPILDLGSDRIRGFEALLRWHHTEGGPVLPTELIPVAEETGLIVPLGWWVLGEACRQMSQWQRSYPSDPPLTMSVNISSRQFLQVDLVPRLEQLMRETDLDPRCLKLEITESTIMHQPEAAAAMLQQLRALGVQVSVDDFGTGYS